MNDLKRIVSKTNLSPIKLIQNFISTLEDPSK